MNFNSILEELDKLYEEKVVSKETDKLCSVVLNGEQQVFTGTKEECEEWIESRKGPTVSRFSIKDSATINTVEEGCTKKALKEDWYGADTEVEFETEVYPDIAKYFGLTENDKVYYAYYFLDEVTVNYTDAKGQDCEIEKHVPIGQVEEWFKAGYYITEAAKKALKEADEEAPEEIPEEDVDTVEDFIKNFDEYDGNLKLEFKPIVIDGKEYPIKQLLWDDTLEEGKLVAEVIFDMPEEEPIEEEIPEEIPVEEPVEENLKGERLPEEDEDLDEFLNANIKVDARGFGGSGNAVDII
jgi:hypothetical protein